jgi:hypothetical protein
MSIGNFTHVVNRTSRKGSGQLLIGDAHLFADTAYGAMGILGESRSLFVSLNHSSVTYLTKMNERNQNMLLVGLYHDGTGH